MADHDNMEELRSIVTRLALLVETIGEQQQQTNANLMMMAERWDGYIVEQRQMNARLQAILERLLPGSGDGRQEA
jgi:uncharacterized protein YcsI (UPF0317 family)